MQSCISSRVEDVARTPSGHYLGYIPASRRHAQSVPPDVPASLPEATPDSTPFATPVLASPYDVECDPDDLLMTAYSTSSEESSDLPELVPSPTPPHASRDAMQEHAPDSPDSPPPASSYLPSAPAIFDALPNNVTSPPLEYNEVMCAIFRMNSVTRYLQGVGDTDRVTSGGDNYITRAEIMEAAKTLRDMLNRMFYRLEMGEAVD